MSIKCFERLKTKEKRVAKNEMVRQYHRLNGHELEQTPGDSEGQRSLPWSCRVRHDLETEQQVGFEYLEVRNSDFILAPNVSTYPLRLGFGSQV